MEYTRAIFLVALVIAAAVFIAKWTADGAIFTGDMVSFEGPLEELMGRWQRRGAVPWWVPEIHGGYPLVANGNISFWYVPHMILRHFLPGPVATNISLLLHSLLAVGGMFAWLRYNRLPPIAAAAGGLLYAFGGAMGARLALSNFYTAMAWVPLLLWLLQWYCVSRRGGVLFAWTVVSALHVFSGNPQAVMLGLVMEGVVVVTVLWNLRSLRPLGGLAGAGVLVTFLVSGHVMPLMWHVPQTERASGLSEAELLEFSFPMRAWQGLWIAHPFGHGETYAGPKGEAEIAAYVGPVALGLVIVGLVASRSLPVTLRVVAGVLFLLGLVLSTGEHYALSRAILTYTPLRYFSNPARYFLWVHTALVVWAAIGLAQLWLKTTAAWHRWALGVAAAAMVVPVLVVTATWEPGVGWTELRTPVLVPGLLGDSTLVRTLSLQGLVDVAPANNFGITVWQELREGTVFSQTFQPPMDEIQRLGLRLSAGGAGVITLALRDETGAVVRTAALDASAVAIDGEWTVFEVTPIRDVRGKNFQLNVSFLGARSLPPRVYIHTNPGDYQYDPTGELSSCRTRCEAVTTDGRTADLAFGVLPQEKLDRPAQQLLGPNVAAGYGVPSAEWTGAMGVSAAMMYLDAVGNGADALRGGRSLVNRLAVSHIVAAAPPFRDVREVAGIRLGLRHEVGHLILQVYRNEQAYPRFHYATTVEAVRDVSDQLARVRVLPATDSNIVVADVFESMTFPTEGSIEVMRDSPRELILQTERSMPGFLVVRDLFYPGWKVWIDGEQANLSRTDVIFRGVEVPAGTHQVVFRFRPMWLGYVIVLSAFGLAALVGWAGILSARRMW